MKLTISTRFRIAALSTALVVGSWTSPTLGEISNSQPDFLKVSGRWDAGGSPEANCRVHVEELTIGFKEPTPALNSALAKAVDVWGSVSGLPRFRIVNSGEADIRIHEYRGRTLPGLTKRLASYESARTLVQFDPATAAIRGADVYLNASHWFLLYECNGGGIGAPTSDRQIALDVVLAHELGHCLGIGHTGQSGNLMREALTRQPFGERRPRTCTAKLGDWDLAAVRELYALQ